MSFSEKIYLNKKTIFIVGILFSFVGIGISYYTYGAEPWETVGGFICGLSLSVSLISLSLKKPTTNV